MRRDNQEFIENQEQQQMMIMQKQDQNLALLGDSVKQLGLMGLEMAEEIEEQNRALDELDTNVSRTQVRMEASTRKVHQLIEKSSTKGLTITIVVLVIILIVLIVIITQF